MPKTINFNNKPDAMVLFALGLGRSALDTGVRKLAALERGETQDVLEFLMGLLRSGDKSILKHMLLSMQDYNRAYVDQIRAEAKRRGIEPEEPSAD